MKTAQLNHTPGPWQYPGWPQSNAAKINEDMHSGNVSLNGEVIAIVYGDTMAQMDANARLIAAAPELYEACKAYERAETDGGVSMADYRTIAHQAIFAAIAKAEGRQQ